MSKSEELFARAQQLIPGGVNSPVRAFKAVGGTPLFISRAEGARVWDADGRAYIDYVGSWGPMILGHAFPPVVAAVRAVHAGLYAVHPDALAPSSRVAGASRAPLSSREREILEMLSEGASNRAIASRLRISRHTAKFHVASILAKLGAASRTEAVALALRTGLLGRVARSLRRILPLPLGERAG